MILNLFVEKLHDYYFNRTTNMSGRRRKTHCCNHASDLGPQEVAKMVNLIELNFVQNVAADIADSTNDLFLNPFLALNLLSLCSTCWCVYATAISSFRVKISPYLARVAIYVS